MNKKWICPRCGNTWKSTNPICEICTEVGFEASSQDLLDDFGIVSLDEARAELEGEEEVYNDWERSF